MNINRLRGRIVEKRLNIGKVAELIDLSKSGLYKRLHRPELLTIGDALKLKELLELTDDEAVDIFLSR